MANFFKDNDDLQYYFDKGIDWESLVRITEHDFADADGEGFSTTKVMTTQPLNMGQLRAFILCYMLLWGC